MIYITNDKLHKFIKMKSRTINLGGHIIIKKSTFNVIILPTIEQHIHFLIFWTDLKFSLNSVEYWLAHVVLNFWEFSICLLSDSLPVHRPFCVAHVVDVHHQVSSHPMIF